MFVLVLRPVWPIRPEQFVSGYAPVATFLFICPPFLGHMNPMMVLASTIRMRGHRIVFAVQQDNEERTRAAGFETTLVGETSLGPGSLAAMEGRMARPNGVCGIRSIVRDMVVATASHCRDVPKVVARMSIDAIVCDQLEPAGGLIARRYRIPFASVTNALPINTEPDIPPPYVGWDYDPTERGRRRNAGGLRIGRWLMKPIEDEIARWAAMWQVGDLRTIEDCLSPLAQVSQCVAGLDFPRRNLPKGFVYTGPFRGPAEPGDLNLPDDERPLVYCSLGTLQGHRIDLFKAVAKACASLNLRLFIAHGGRLSATDLARLPGRPLTLAYAPQRAILARSAAAICHAGFNTVLDALSFGVPLLLMPLGFEQPGTGARVARVGAGIVLRRRSTNAVARGIARILGDPAFSERARHLAEEISRAGGAECAAGVVERIVPS